ncbi:unnamed protein product [Peniophora sp. CBMAI 1063]|nr:unnamed protein product [Peniophora sp. CBMAI 1063]
MALNLVAFDILFVFSVIAMVAVWRRSQTSKVRRGLPLPPGPRGLPVVGNLFDMPDTNEWVVYRDWGVKYGSDVVCVSTIGLHVVIVNSARAAHDLFERRSALYSDRPALTAIRYIGADTWNLGFLRYGAEWRTQRKLFHEQFRPEVLSRYEPHQEKAVHEFLRAMAASSGHAMDMDQFRSTIRQLTGTTIVYIAYGREVQGPDDPYLVMLEEAVAAINEATKLKALTLDLLPFLQRMPVWFPGAGFKKYAAEVRPHVGEVVRDKPWDEFVADTKAGCETRRASIAGQLLTKYGNDPALLDAAKAVVSVMYVAGADTTVSALSSFFLAMVLCPDSQRRAQKELDDVLRGSLPTLANQDDLPYTTALVKEVFRWHPVTTLGVPHALTEDDVYNNMFIPAGSTVIGNVWAILHDPSLFPDPDTFDPAHFISSDNGGTYPVEACKRGEPPFPEAAFGFGRRICLGRLLAKNTVWLTVASVLSAFDILPVKDENGVDVPVEDTWSSGTVGFPARFECIFRPRSQQAMEAISVIVTET